MLGLARRRQIFGLHRSIRLSGGSESAQARSSARIRCRTLPTLSTRPVPVGEGDPDGLVLL